MRHEPLDDAALLKHFPQQHAATVGAQPIGTRRDVQAVVEGRNEHRRRFTHWVRLLRSAVMTATR
jgi:hypothetical protein